MGVGFGSALTGTSGPLLLVPTLTWLRLPVLTTLGLSQVIQLPIALLATVGNWISAGIDVRLGAMLSVGLLGGVTAGALLVHRLPRRLLSITVALVMAGAGIFVVARSLRP